MFDKNECIILILGGSNKNMNIFMFAQLEIDHQSVIKNLTNLEIGS